MPNKPLSELPLVTSVGGADQLLVGGSNRITVADFADSLAGSAVTCTVTGGPVLTTGYPIVTGNLRLRNGADVAGKTVQIYFGNSSGESFLLDGSTTTDGSGNYSYNAKPKGDGVRTLQARVGDLWSGVYTLTTDQTDVAATSVTPLLDWVIEGLAVGTKITRLDPVGGIVDDVFTYAMLDTQGGRFAISGKYLTQGATGTTAAGGTRHPQVRATSIYTGLHVDVTLDIRVFAEPDWTIEPTAADPYTLGLDVVFDMNPLAATINAGSPSSGDNINTATFDGRSFASLATVAYKPKWYADGGNGKPCVRTATNNQGLKSTDAALLALFAGDHPVLTTISIYKQHVVPGGAAFVFSARQTTTVGNAAGQRFVQRADAGSVTLVIGDDSGSISAASTSSWAAGAALAVDDTTCAFGYNGSKSGFGVERDFDPTTRLGVRDKAYHPFDPGSAMVDVTIGDKGGAASGMVGDYYRHFIIRGVPTLRQRYAIVKWAHAQYGLSHPPTWATFDMAAKTVTYDMDAEITNGVFDIVTHGATPGSEAIAELGWQSTPAGSSSTAYAGYIHTTSEDTGFPNILNDVWQDRVTEAHDSEVWHYWQNMLVGETKVCPIGYEPYILLAGVQKQYIGPMMQNRYGGTKYMHGQYSGEYVIPTIAKGGKGMWGGLWSLGDASSSSTVYNEQDLQEHDGLDMYGLYMTTHDQTLSGTALGYYFVVDDQSAGINQVIVDVQADYLTYYYNGLLMWRQPTPIRNQGSKYGLIDLTTGKTDSAFHGSVDGTTVFPNTLVVRNVKFTRNPIAIPSIAGADPAEALALIATMTAPTLTEQNVIKRAYKRLQNCSSLYPDGVTYTLWQKLNYLYVLAMQDTLNTRRDWKLPSRAAFTIYGSPTFTAGQGYAAVTAGDYIDTGILMSSAGFANNATDQSMGVWNLTQPTNYTKRFAHGDDKYQINPSPQTTGTGKTNTTFIMFGTTGAEVLYNDVGPGCHVWSRGYGMVTPWFNGKINGILAAASTTAIDTTTPFTATGTRRILGATGLTTSASLYDGKIAAAWATAWLTEDHQIKLYDILYEALHDLGAV